MIRPTQPSIRISLAALLLFLIFATSLTADDNNAGNPLIGWDQILDPDEDCEIKSIITIKVPKSYKDLNSSRRGRGINAPRLLKQVSGDFTAQVKITHDFDPTVGNGAFIAAGLVIWEDETHFLRLERSAFMRNGELHCEYPPVEHWRSKSHIGFPPRYVPAAEIYSGPSTWLKIQRKDEKLTAWISNDGKEWKVAKEKKDLFPDDVSVGLHVVNASGSELTFQFEEFDVQLH